MKFLNKHYQETIKLLILLSSSASLQRQAHGIGHAEEELATDLEFHYSEHKTSLLAEQLMTLKQMQLIDEIERLFEQKSNDQDEDFWTSLESHQDWQTIRELASYALKEMGKENLTINVSVKTNTSWFSKNIASQQIDVTIVEKEQP